MIDWMARLAGVAAVVAGLELLVVRRAFTRPFHVSIVGADLPAVMRPLFGAHATIAICSLLVATGVALLVGAPPPVAALGAVCVLAVAVRFRGTFNGGSDSMLLYVLVALALPARYGLALAAGQLTLSYVLAGIAKLGDPAWRSGTALATLVDLPQYAVPRPIARVLASPLGRGAAFVMLAFECTFPLAFLHPTACWIYLGIGAAFHLANAVAFGLNRFLWTWLAAYPAMVHWGA